MLSSPRNSRSPLSFPGNIMSPLSSLNTLIIPLGKGMPSLLLSLLLNSILLAALRLGCDFLPPELMFS